MKKKKLIKLGSWLGIIIVLIMYVVIAEYFDNKGINKSANENSNNIFKSVIKSKPSEKELLKLKVETEKKEEKIIAKKQKAYDNEIRPEETAVRVQPSEERQIGVTLNNKGSAKVKITSESKEVKIIENGTMDITEDNFDDQFRKFKMKISDNAKPNQKVKIKLSEDNLPTETVIVNIDTKAKDTKDICFYYDMVPGMTFSTDFITSIVTYQEKQKLDYTYKIKNYKKDVLIEKAGEIRALNIGDAVVTITYEGKKYKIYVRVREEEIYPEPNKEETSIHFVNPITEKLEVGDEYSLIAVTLPYTVTKNNANFYDKMAYYESSDTDVCTVTYCDVRAEGPGTCTITAYNKDRTLSTSIDVTVVKKKTVKYTGKNTMEITPQKAKEYGLSEIDGKSTTDGLKKIVKDAKEKGMKKVYFTKALDLVMEPYGDDYNQVYLNSNTMYDFNGTNIKVVEHEIKQNEWGYFLFVMEGVHDTILRNLNMTSFKPKGGTLVSFPDAVNCVVEGCNLGYSYWNIATYSAYYEDGHMKDINADVFEFGNIRSDGTEGDSKCRVRSDYIDITHIDEDEDFMIGDYTEFGNYNNAPSIIYDIAYYDKDKKFIKKESCHAQFFAYYRPKNAKYCRIVFHTEQLPKNGTEGYYTGYCVKIGHVKRGYKCTIKNNVLHNATHVNLVLCGEQRCVIEENYFYQDGDIGCDIDWEDFFQAKSCDIVRDNVFTTRYDSIACVSGMGYVFRNNAFYHQAYVNITGGTRLFRMFGNVFRNIPSIMENGYDSIVNNNVFGNTFYFKRYETDKSTNGIIPRLRVENNTVYNY